MAMRHRDREEWFWITLMIIAVAIMAWLTIADWFAV